MRKLTVLSLAGLLILAFSAVGYAQAPKLEFRASGFIDAQTFWGEGVPQYQTGSNTYLMTNPNYGGQAVGGATVAGVGWKGVQSNWEGRAHLKFDAVMGPNLSGTIYFEIDSMRYGGVFNTGANTREANNFGAWTTDRTAVEVKNIYVDVGIPYFGIPVPITVRVGAQPIGVRPNVMVYSDGAGVTAGIKIDPVLIMPIYAKALQNLDFADDGSDVYGLHGNAKIGTFTVGGYGLLYRMNTYPFYVVTGAGAAGTAIPGQSSGTGYSSITTQLPGTYKSHMFWGGLYADGKAGPVNLNFDWVMDYGTVQERNTPYFGNGVPIPNVVNQGWVARLKVDYPWEKFNFGGVGMYATGADARRTSPTGLPGSFTTNWNNGIGAAGTPSRYNSSYLVPPGSEQGPANGESMVVYSMEPGATGGYGIADNANYGALSRGGFGGTWFGKLYATMKLAPWYSLTLQTLYIGDTTEHGTTFGSAVKYSNTNVYGVRLRNQESIGWEFDLLNQFQIYNNLRFFVGAGYLFAGNAMDVSMPTGTSGIYVNRAAPNPWAIRTRLMYTF